MLKSKKGIYVLLPLVVLIWGMIIYKVVDAFSDKDPITAQDTVVTFTEIKTTEREKFEIGKVGRDPFLGKIYQPEKKVVKSNKPIRKKETIAWPTIQYKGLVSGQNSSKAIYLVAINGSDQLMNPKSSFAEVTLIKGSSKSITLRYKGQRKQFPILQ